MKLGWRAFGIGVMAVAIVALVFGDFHPGQPVPKDFPARTTLAYAAAGFMLISGLAIEWRRTTAWGAAALCAYYTLIVLVLMDGRMIWRNWDQYLAYSNTAEQLAVAAGALIVFADHAKIDEKRAALLTRIGQVAFGICAILFGGAHFAYMSMTAPLVPKWLPMSGEAWGYATGVFHIAGGLAIISRILGRIAATLTTVMYALFTPLALAPLLFADPTKFGAWAENATNIVLIGVAWVVTDSFAPKVKSALAPSEAASA